ncbi:MAG: IPT/TIG domain-containing protein [Planctomycetota bacterium]
MPKTSSSFESFRAGPGAANARTVAGGHDVDGDGFPDMIAGFVNTQTGDWFVRVLSLGGALPYGQDVAHDLDLRASKFSPPQLGGININVDGASAMAAGIAAASLSPDNTTFASIPILVDISDDLFLLENFNFDGTGSAHFHLNLSDPRLVGTTAYLQMFGVGNQKILASNGLEILFLDWGLELSGITPLVAQAGDTSTITGTAISPMAEVLVNGVPVTPTSVSETEIDFTAPSNLLGCGDKVTVRNAPGFEQPLELNPQPVISTLSTTSGLASGGNTLVIGGGVFPPGTVVTFGFSPATIILSTGTTILVTVPAGDVGPVDLTVFTPSGCFATTSYTYQ